MAEKGMQKYKLQKEKAKYRFGIMDEPDDTEKDKVAARRAQIIGNNDIIIKK